MVRRFNGLIQKLDGKNYFTLVILHRLCRIVSVQLITGFFGSALENQVNAMKDGTISLQRKVGYLWFVIFIVACEQVLCLSNETLT